MKLIDSGYRADRQDWQRFLRCWDGEQLEWIRNDPEEVGSLPLGEKAIEKGSILKGPASTKSIEEAEAHLKVALPKSYVDFISTTNGMIDIGFDAFEGGLTSIGDVGWFGDKYPMDSRIWSEAPDLAITDREYFDYSVETQRDAYGRREYVNETVVISSDSEGHFYLLNAAVQFDDGEFEAWYLGPTLPGVIRFPSFAHMMRHAYYKAARQVEFDVPYTEDQLEGTCADLLPVEDPTIEGL